MSYIKQTWADGDIITDSKLNHIENGIEAASASELPSHTSSDSGKVLTVSPENDLDWSTVDSGLPDYDYDDNGKALIVGGGGIVWHYILPQYDEYDDGKYLTITNDQLAWDYVLPSTSDNNGKILAVNAVDSSIVEWVDNPVPTWDTSGHDQDKVLTISDNALTWSNVLPSYSTSGSDNGKVLSIYDNSVSWTEILPTYDENAGKVLVVNSTEDGVKWSDILPHYGAEDDGKVLAVTAGNGAINLEWRSL